ncbi:hypothetical protein FA15DRAFT_658189 [Coprinopsis marcescibilis]|uniref:Uncharacterized protein n=1 Tax=Coprinopsis marcescibilis TaxID=230819 RepID=A0A5C3KMI1_COPMA|nr:hypothetical protein FA15DRAFT_658189 [Coprinopsis marcescibilis]
MYTYFHSLRDVLVPRASIWPFRHSGGKPIDSLVWPSGITHFLDPLLCALDRPELPDDLIGQIRGAYKAWLFSKQSTTPHSTISQLSSKSSHPDSSPTIHAMSSETELIPHPGAATSAIDAPPNVLEEFEHAVSSNSTAYKVGGSTQAGSTAMSSAAPPTFLEFINRPRKWVDVDWPVTACRVFTPEDIRNETHVRFYHLVYEAHSFIYSYELYINTEKPGRYEFRMRRAMCIPLNLLRV